MAISFDKALGIHPQAMQLRVDRAEVLANNLANADTPGFKARDLDFQTILSNQQDLQAGQPLAMQTTNGKHLPLSTESEMLASNTLMYRTPSQPSVDGNTVDSQQELAEFMKNTMDYQASFQFLNSKFKGLLSAIKGE